MQEPLQALDWDFRIPRFSKQAKVHNLEPGWDFVHFAVVELCRTFTCFFDSGGMGIPGPGRTHAWFEESEAL